MRDKAMKYDQTFSGRPHVMRSKTHLRACCDCGLVHRYRFQFLKRGMRVTVWRMPRQTGGMRAGLKRNRRGVFGRRG